MLIFYDPLITAGHETGRSPSKVVVQRVPFKTQPNNSYIIRYKTEIKEGHLRVIASAMTLESVLPSSAPVAQTCACSKMVYSRAECVFILEHYYFASKSFAAVGEAFGNAYSDKEVRNTTIHRLVTQFLDTGSVYL
jgi:hypothetical protein